MATEKAIAYSVLMLVLVVESIADSDTRLHREFGSPAPEFNPAGRRLCKLRCTRGRDLICRPRMCT